MPTPDSIEPPASILSADRLAHGELQQLWRRSLAQHSTDPAAGWLGGDAALSRGLVTHALAAGAFFLACDAARKGLEAHPDDAQLSRDLGVGLLRLGSVTEARSVFSRFLSSPAAAAPADRARTLGLIGDCFFAEATEPEDLVAQDLRSALREYEGALLLAPGDMTLESRAAVVGALLAAHPHGQDLGARKGALRRAKWVIAARLHRATASELLYRALAAAVVGDRDLARRAFRAAGAHPGATAPTLARARAAARLLAASHGWPPSDLDRAFPPLVLLVFSGHGLDDPTASVQRFAPAAEARVGALIARAIAALRPSVAISGAAAGADLIFAEQVQAFRSPERLPIENHIVLPWAEDAFVDAKVRKFGAGWVERFQAARAATDSVRVLGEAEIPRDAAGLEFCSTVMSGFALRWGQSLGLDIVPLTLWNGERGEPGGPGSFVETWRGLNYEVQNVLDDGAQREFLPRARVAARARPVSLLPGPGRPQRPSPLPKSHGLSREVRTMLFADVVGYSRIPDTAIPAYVEHFMGLTSRLMSESRYSPISVNTWGDALYFVFDTAEAAGLFALDLVDRVSATKWLELGLTWGDAEGKLRQQPLSIRTGLHTGPVYGHYNPVVRALGFTGAHVSRAARIEPITPHARIYASEEFAAVAAVEGVEDFRCHFVGTLALAKKYPGDFRMFEVRRLRRFPVGLVARAIHDEYVRSEVRAGSSLAANPWMCAWDDLPEHLQDENRRQAAAIKDKLYRLGFTLVPIASGRASELVFSAEQVEMLAREEHERWFASKRSQGWTVGVRDDAMRTHPLLVLWGELPGSAREKNLQAIRAIPALLVSAGFGAGEP